MYVLIRSGMKVDGPHYALCFDEDPLTAEEACHVNPHGSGG